jgi:hypothetical protein
MLADVSRCKQQQQKKAQSSPTTQHSAGACSKLVGAAALCIDVGLCFMGVQQGSACSHTQVGTGIEPEVPGLLTCHDWQSLIAVPTSNPRLTVYRCWLCNISTQTTEVLQPSALPHQPTETAAYRTHWYLTVTQMHIDAIRACMRTATSLAC